MSIKHLQAYMSLCRETGQAPTWEGLGRYDMEARRLSVA